MTEAEAIKALEAEWQLETGFLGKIRQSQFDREGLARLLAALEDLQLDGDAVARELVRVLWYIPPFMQWNKERTLRVSEIEGSEYDKAETEIMNRLERILGLP